MRIAFVGDSLTAGIPGSSYLAILRERLPGHSLVNLGKGNDTVVSLYRRLARRPLDRGYDVAFLWVGVNDVGESSSWTSRLINALSRQPRSRDLDEFRDNYERALALLCRYAGRVVAVSPLLKGEKVDNPWNRQLAEMSNTIEELTVHHERAEYLDLRSVFVQKLAGRRTSDYLPKSALRVALDALTLRTDEQVDRKAAARGLYLTLDGVHLNGAGAEIVAEAFLQALAG